MSAAEIEKWWPRQLHGSTSSIFHTHHIIKLKTVGDKVEWWLVLCCNGLRQRCQRRTHQVSNYCLVDFHLENLGHPFTFYKIPQDWTILSKSPPLHLSLPREYWGGLCSMVSQWRLWLSAQWTCLGQFHSAMEQPHGIVHSQIGSSRADYCKFWYLMLTALPPKISAPSSPSCPDSLIGIVHWAGTNTLTPPSQTCLISAKLSC